jgi:ribosomal protein S27AE
MTTKLQIDPGKWICGRCGLPLEMGKVSVSYLGSAFPVELPRCPKCGMVYVTEALASGKMSEVEKLLEDK